jgi:3-methylcrotonyl-CoA carboxylase alpha subunit
LDQFHVVGLHTNLPFLRRLSAHPAFQEGLVETGFIPKYHDALIPTTQPSPPQYIALATLAVLLQEVPTSPASPNDPYSPWDRTASFRVNGTLSRTVRWVDPEKKDGEIKVSVVTHPDGTYGLTFGNHSFRVRGEFRGDSLSAHVGDTYYHDVLVVRKDDSEVNVFHQGYSVTLVRPATVPRKAGDAHAGSLLSPMPGKIVKVAVKVGDKVAKGAPLVIMEAMKMEHTIRAPAPGVVESVRYNVGEIVEEKKVLVTLTTETK